MVERSLLSLICRCLCCFTLLSAFVFFQTSSSSSSVSVRIHTGWKACRWNNSSANDQQCFPVSRLPTTALAVLIQNQQIPGLENLTVNDLYTSRNLERVPDISIVGRDYYSLRYEYNIDSAIICTDPAQQRLTLRIAGVNYQATAWLDQVPLHELGYGQTQQQQTSMPPPGMFRRRNYVITLGSGKRFSIGIQPPYHPGRPIPNAQGGDHSLAQDGAVPQYMLGWDWCPSMPDRATGFYGSVKLECSGRFAMQDPTVQTVNISGCYHLDDNQNKHYKTSCSFIKLRILVNIEDGEPRNNQGNASREPLLLHVKADWGETWQFIVLRNKNNEDDLFKAEILVKKTESVRIWWPHGLGVPDSHLHRFQFSLFQDDLLIHSTTINVGIRTVETFLDEKIQGQRFRINGADIYLVGGNWIGTDQMLRYSASKSRYCNEIALHRHAGLNLLRVWGGGTAERTEFYECADELGMLVYQEFWMTGDNNGRWAGNYSYPLDYDAYLANVEDTVKRLRRHPSLLFYAGCNECLAPPSSFWGPNPPREINDGIQAILKQYDPGRFYIASSMGGANKADKFINPSMWYNRSYSLAFSDGPYNMLLPSTFFQRNPGLPIQDVSIGFQPEIGSVGMPTYLGLQRIMKLADIESGFPHRNQKEARNDVWTFHNFQSWTTLLDNNETYDHVYAYFATHDSVNASDWFAAAQLALHLQYQSMFDGFISHMFDFTTAMIMWKTQSPWPSLRGFLYDWFLETTGSLRGVFASLSSPVSVIFDPSLWRLRIINRSIQNFLTSSCSIGAEYSWIDMHGRIIESSSLFSSHDVTAMQSFFLGNFSDVVQWPRGCSTVCFLRLHHAGTCWTSSATNWYWLTKRSAYSRVSDFSLLGQLRRNSSANVEIQIHRCYLREKALHVHVSIYVASDSPVVLFYPSFRLLIKGKYPLFPLFDSRENDVVLLPGSDNVRELETPVRIHSQAGLRVRVELSSWNTATINQDIICQYFGPAPYISKPIIGT